MVGFVSVPFRSKMVSTQNDMEIVVKVLESDSYIVYLASLLPRGCQAALINWAVQIGSNQAWASSSEGLSPPPQ